MAGRREAPEVRSETSTDRSGKGRPINRKTLGWGILAAAGVITAIGGQVLENRRINTERGETRDALCALVSVLENTELEDSDKEKLCTNALIKSCLQESDLCKGEEE